MLAATHAENAAPSETYAQSEEIAESRSLSPVQKTEKIAASSYDEEVRATVGKTKKRIQEELPEARSNDLHACVDEQWQQEIGEFNATAAAGPSATAARRAAGGAPLRFRVYATQY